MQNSSLYAANDCSVSFRAADETPATTVYDPEPDALASQNGTDVFSVAFDTLPTWVDIEEDVALSPLTYAPGVP